MKKLTCFFAFLGMLTSLWAQSGSVSGTITDIDGNGLAGANVVLDGTSLGTASDANGSYSISNVPFGSYTITASYIGHESASQAVHVGDAAVTVNFELAAEAIAMGGVMVTGSRAAGRTAMKSPTPIDGFDDMTLRRQGNGDFTETLKNQVPSFNATPLTGDGAAFVRPTSLRGLPPDNILVLVNSKRRHRSALISHFGAAMNVGAHAVDVGMIPGIAL
ncbi:MAG: carboxypeptidase-like regulatory domain-containing protein, partial [Candidatus Marinimicrobia bacterium]|nr:carboxypeptidase-like regulatory domain-containing protein [Candidatus Neomarinimicrobiota bacterium]MDP7071938.1 carboxypeptidase-like regulatory domain-containing protein [Candidatus Neomarinimicrobiota bacterium]